MSTSLFADSQNLLRQRRLERGLTAEMPPQVPARRLLLLGSGLGVGIVALVLFCWTFLAIRDRFVVSEISRMSGVPGQLKALETQLSKAKTELDRQGQNNQHLASGLVAVSSGSALVTQLAQITPSGVQITEATVTDTTLSLKGLADDPGAFARVNALSLLVAYAPLFKPEVRVIKLARSDQADSAIPAANTQSSTGVRAGTNTGSLASVPVAWELLASLKRLKPAEQLSVLRRLGADGMVQRLQELQRTGALP